MRMAIGELLLLRLEQVGLCHIFGVPGDFNLEFMQQLEDRGKPEWVGNCNELNASYAADGYARISGLGALIVTYGVGALSAINGVAGAYAEHVPLICICGSLPLRAVSNGLLMHHTMADGTRDNVLRAFRQFTVAQAQLTPQNAVTEIDRIITTAWMLKRPVYLELPSDIAYIEVEVLAETLHLPEPGYDAERLSACASQIEARLKSAHSPVLLLDMDTDRFHALEEARSLAEKLQIPVATMAGSKGTFPTSSPLFAGTYTGSSTAKAVKQLVEESDCLITMGYRRVDSTSAFFADALPSSAIYLNAFEALVDGKYFPGLSLKPLLRALTGSSSQRPKAAGFNKEQQAKAIVASERLTQAQYWEAIQAFLKPDDVILAEDGTSSSGGGSLRLPEGCTFITQAIWGSIGYTLGALLGTLLAAPTRRHILLIGDGSFQLTCQEPSTILRHQLKPYIFLINNGGYTSERTILGKNARYNDVANWSYADLPILFSRPAPKSHVIRTEKRFENCSWHRDG